MLPTSEFTVPKDQQTPAWIRACRLFPVRWIFAHAARYWYLGLAMVGGAIGNAGLAAVVPIYVGQAMDTLLKSPPDISILGKITYL